jgi:hypothetical protein
MSFRTDTTKFEEVLTRALGFSANAPMSGGAEAARTLTLSN